MSKNYFEVPNALRGVTVMKKHKIQTFWGKLDYEL